MIFFFCQTFEKLFIIHANFFNKTKRSIVIFEPKTFHDNNLKLILSRDTRLLHNTTNALFIIWYDHYMLKITKCWNYWVSKLGFQILIII
jgi:hypothetical protein